MGFKDKVDTFVYDDGKLTPIKTFTSIDNTILDKLAEVEMTCHDRMVLNRVIRDTLGWETKNLKGVSFRRLKYEIPVSRFVEKTGLTEVEVGTSLGNLEKRNVIKRQGDLITFNHHLDEWTN